MAKTLEKVRKEFDLLYIQLGSLHQEAASAENNFGKLMGLARDAAREAGQEAAELKKKGHTGKCLDDFRSEKEVKNHLKMWDKYQATAGQLESKVAQMMKEFPGSYKKLQTMAADLEKEIANRDKKANRKLFKIQSESLPDLKKLLADMQKAIKDLEDTLDRAQDTLTDITEGFDPPFEEVFNNIFQRSAKDQLQEDRRMMVTGAKNIRAQAKYLRECRDMNAQIKQLCTDAAKAVKNGDSPQQYLDSAVAIYRKLDEVAKVQQKLLGTYNAANQKNATGDLKKVLDSANACIALSKQSLALLTKTTSASMGPVPSRKGKEKVS